eukprot:TRINITY_DN14337_c0_g1_i1.p1 TRINITY_DN14337_c0_g1~~TRINITY_DN14337_c0_g1_i1.p1  ORF type:complete len:343 (+),score=50.46 TRINITY_DN14337_c0_g1_i1:25-1029(+)
MKALAKDEFYSCLLSTAFASVQREHPNFLDEVNFSLLTYDGTPSHLHPAFFGSYDWHSSVHSHWTIVRLLRLDPSLPLFKEVLELLKSHFAPSNIKQELSTFSYLAEWELPYGYSWFLALVANVHKWDVEESREFLEALSIVEKPLKNLFAIMLAMLKEPDRKGMHHNTAFALILLYNYGKTVGDKKFTEIIKGSAMKFFFNDESFEDNDITYCFLSPSLCVLHLMSLILEREKFIVWASERKWQFVLELVPAKGDPSHPYRSHEIGLNFTRCWSMNHLAHFFPKEEPVFRKLAKEHYETSLPFISCGEWYSDHWLATYALMAQMSFTQNDILA